MGKRDRLISEHPVLGMPLIDFFYLSDPSENHRYIEFMWKSFFDEKNSKTSEEKALYVSKLLFPTDTKATLNRYHEHYLNNRIPNPDLSTYKSYKDMVREVVKADEAVKLAMLSKDVDKIFQDDDWLIVLPHTHESMAIYGKSTKWCVTSKSTWVSYRPKNRILVAINKKDNNKFAISVEYKNTGVLANVSAWDQKDNSISVFKVGLSPEAMMEVIKFVNQNLFEHWARRAEKGYLGYLRGNDIHIEKLRDTNYLNEFIELTTPYLSEELKNQLIKDSKNPVNEKPPKKGPKRGSITGYTFDNYEIYEERETEDVEKTYPF